jgi:3'-phosphoadenosine 5'-phosphosulfate (PAPS) 3'-phosphatase
MKLSGIAAFPPIAAKANDKVKVVKSSNNKYLFLIEGDYYVYDRVAKTTTKVL